MCGILGIIGEFEDTYEALRMSKRMKHRGPDESGYVHFDEGNFLSHERLAIIDLKTGTQPIKGSNGLWVAHNGEIYNHEHLRKQVARLKVIPEEEIFHTTCDSEIIPYMCVTDDLDPYGLSYIETLNGVFAFVVINENDRNDYIVARDALGIKPLYVGEDDKGRIFIASEMKAIIDKVTKIKQFEPGYVFSKKFGGMRWFKPRWLNDREAVDPIDYSLLKTSLRDSVEKRMMSDVPLGVLLSGGLDSSLIASIAAKLKPGLKSFSVGFDKDSPDLKAAREVASFIGTDHNELVLTIDQGIEALKDVIWHLESYDVTTVRASVPMYFLSKFVRENGVEVVLSGEGADEIFGGYLYFHNAPSTLEFQKETIRRVLNLHYADVLRADKAMMAHAVETRVPFLDRDFLDVAMLIDPIYKIPRNNREGIEKYILRKAFDDGQHLPDSILWRQKEQFGDGVGYSWIDSLIKHAEKEILDEEFSEREKLFPYNTPQTKEAFLYRKIFAELYPQEIAAKTVKEWVPTWQENKDPSGRANNNHKNKML